jgi:hypothetical protein
MGVDAVSSTNHGECLGWLTKRKLRFSSVALYTYVDTDDLNIYFAAVGGSHVRRVQLVGIPDVNAVLETFTRCCSAVSHLVVRDVTGPATVTPLLTACSAHLVCVHVRANYCTLDVFNHFSQLHLPNLRRLCLKCTCGTGVLRMFSSASTRLEQLHIGSLEVDDDDIDLLSNNAGTLQGLGTKIVEVLLA